MLTNRFLVATIHTTGACFLLSLCVFGKHIFERISQQYACVCRAVLFLHSTVHAQNVLQFAFLVYARFATHKYTYRQAYSYQTCVYIFVYVMTMRSRKTHSICERALSAALNEEEKVLQTQTAAIVEKWLGLVLPLDCYACYACLICCIFALTRKHIRTPHKKRLSYV